MFDPFDASVPGTSVLMGIALTARKDSLVQGNRIAFPANSVGAGPNLPTTGITLSGCPDARVIGNVITGETVPAPAQKDLVGILIPAPSTGIIIFQNVFKNLADSVRQNATPPAPQVTVGGNVFSNSPVPNLAWEPPQPNLPS